MIIFFNINIKITLYSFFIHFILSIASFKIFQNLIQPIIITIVINLNKNFKFSIKANYIPHYIIFYFLPSLIPIKKIFSPILIQYLNNFFMENYFYFIFFLFFSQFFSFPLLKKKENKNPEFGH